MAVESPHVNFLSPQLLIIDNHNDSEIMMKPNYLIHNNETDCVIPMSPSTMNDSNFFFPLFQQSTTSCHKIPTSFNKSETGLTYHLHQIPVSKKLSRDSVNDSNYTLPISHKNKFSSLIHQPSFLQNQDFLLYNQQFEMAHFIAQHTEKMRMELEEQRVRDTRMLLCMIQEAMEKKVKEKDEEINRMVNLNWLLQEKVKNLYGENQLWRDIAQSNEATVISLRTNLEQIIAAHISEDHRDDDKESSCGSNYVEECGGDAVVGRMCKNCGVRESIVLLLPCRHLCLCRVCGSANRNCPLCHCAINGSVHVNFDYQF